MGLVAVGGALRTFNYALHAPKPRKLMRLSSVIPAEDKQEMLPTVRSLAAEAIDQGLEGCCVNNSFAVMKQHADERYLGVIPLPSRNFGYSECLRHDGNPGQDVGTTLESAAWVYKNIGVPPETMYPYDPEYLTKTPPPEVYAEAAKHRINEFYSLKSEYEIKHSIAHGHMVSFGTAVMKQLISDDLTSGKIKLIKCFKPEDYLLDSRGNRQGHCMTIAGYNDIFHAFEVLNSWGKDFCMNGRFFFGYDDMLNSDWVDEIVTLRLLHEKK